MSLGFLLVVGSCICASLGLLGMWLIARKHRVGWLVSLIANVVGIAYDSVTRQYGWIVGSIVGAVISVRAWRAWKDATDPTSNNKEKESWNSTEQPTQTPNSPATGRT